TTSFISRILPPESGNADSCTSNVGFPFTSQLTFKVSSAVILLSCVVSCVVTLKELITGLLEHEQKIMDAKKKRVEESEVMRQLFLGILILAFLKMNNARAWSRVNFSSAIKIER